MPRPAVRRRELHFNRRILSSELRQAGTDALKRRLRGKPLTGRAGPGKQRLNLAQLLAELRLDVHWPTAHKRRWQNPAFRVGRGQSARSRCPQTAIDSSPSPRLRGEGRGEGPSTGSDSRRVPPGIGCRLSPRRPTLFPVELEHLFEDWLGHVQARADRKQTAQRTESLGITCGLPRRLAGSGVARRGFDRALGHGHQYRAREQGAGRNRSSALSRHVERRYCLRWHANLHWTCDLLTTQASSEPIAHASSIAHGVLKDVHAPERKWKAYSA
jgi:hypothetical protein